MRYTYSPIDGRHTGITADDGAASSTDVVPPAPLPAGAMHRWNGQTWDVVPYAAPAPTWDDASLDPRYHWIDTGPWRDRFGIDWLAITSSDNALCKAAAQLWIDRKYINLKDARNAQMLDAMIAAAQPAPNLLFPGAGPMTAEKKAAILRLVTTDYERHIKGMVQPA